MYYCIYIYLFIYYLYIYLFITYLLIYLFILFYLSIPDFSRCCSWQKRVTSWHSLCVCWHKTFFSKNTNYFSLYIARERGIEGALNCLIWFSVEYKTRGLPWISWFCILISYIDITLVYVSPITWFNTGFSYLWFASKLKTIFSTFLWWYFLISFNSLLLIYYLISSWEIYFIKWLISQYNNILLTVL